MDKAVLYSKIVFLAGAILLFFSLFLEWYNFHVLDENNVLIATWSYNIVFEWETAFPSGSPINEGFRPHNLNVPLAITILFTIILITAVFVVLLKDVTSTTSITTLRKYSFMPFFLLVMTLFYVVIFPLVYLLPQELYFPELNSIDSELEYTFSYSISFGYILQLIGFVMIFSYSLYYYRTISDLEKNCNNPSLQIETVIQKVQQPLDLDRYIAEEEIGRDQLQ
jgi:hypothetical protein